MTQEELIKTLKGIRVWTPTGSTARQKLNDLIIKLGGRI